MPQLDQFTYFSQFVWLTLSFLVYYVVVVHSSLPKLSRILKSRARFLSQQTSSVASKHGAPLGQDKVNDTLVTDCIHSSAHYLHESVAAAQAWCSSSVAQFKHNELVKANRSYLKILSELTLAQVMWKAARAPLSFERILFKRFTLLVSPKKSQHLVQNTTSSVASKPGQTHKVASLGAVQTKTKTKNKTTPPKSNKVKRK